MPAPLLPLLLPLRVGEGSSPICLWPAELAKLSPDTEALIVLGTAEELVAEDDGTGEGTCDCTLARAALLPPVCELLEGKPAARTFAEVDGKTAFTLLELGDMGGVPADPAVAAAEVDEALLLICGTSVGVARSGLAPAAAYTVDGESCIAYDEEGGSADTALTRGVDCCCCDRVLLPELGRWPFEEATDGGVLYAECDGDGDLPIAALASLEVAAEYPSTRARTLDGTPDAAVAALLP